MAKNATVRRTFTTYVMLCMIGAHGVDDGGGGANVGRGRAQLALLQTR